MKQSNFNALLSPQPEIKSGKTQISSKKPVKPAQQTEKEKQQLIKEKEEEEEKDLEIEKEKEKPKPSKVTGIVEIEKDKSDSETSRIENDKQQTTPRRKRGGKKDKESPLKGRPTSSRKKSPTLVAVYNTKSSSPQGLNENQSQLSPTLTSSQSENKDTTDQSTSSSTSQSSDKKNISPKTMTISAAEQIFSSFVEASLPKLFTVLRWVGEFVAEKLNKEFEYSDKEKKKDLLSSSSSQTFSLIDKNKLQIPSHIALHELGLILPPLVVMLTHMCSEEDERIRSLASQCLGEIGALDPENLPFAHDSTVKFLGAVISVIFKENIKNPHSPTVSLITPSLSRASSTLSNFSYSGENGLELENSGLPKVDMNILINKLQAVFINQPLKRAHSSRIMPLQPPELPIQRSNQSPQNDHQHQKEQQQREKGSSNRSNSPSSPKNKVIDKNSNKQNSQQGQMSYSDSIVSFLASDHPARKMVERANSVMSTEYSTTQSRREIVHNSSLLLEIIKILAQNFSSALNDEDKAGLALQSLLTIHIADHPIQMKCNSLYLNEENSPSSTQQTRAQQSHSRKKKNEVVPHSNNDILCPVADLGSQQVSSKNYTDAVVIISLIIIYWN
ncbi:MAG: hypothetical protein EZS28_001017 [Streblomastix strix]|uniref:Uncharacterized protein n=1 Tax=Streblomastix strix TaxID=222440 RepID=A0A5J4X8E4_9EUKA|nr:MAG: hypothetical protein EZS28_001017 [Streblomastix strix]